jgi:hypothetical protein
VGVLELYDPLFEEVARDILEYNYYYIENQYQLLEQYGVMIAKPSLVVLSGKEVRGVHQTDNIAKQSLIDILQTEKFPLISEIDTKTMRLIFNDASHDGIFLIFVKDKQHSSTVSKFTSFARSHKSSKYLFFVADSQSVYGSKLISNLRLTEGPSVRVEIISAKDRERRFAYTGAITEQGLGDFLREYENDAVTPFGNSESPRHSTTKETSCVTNIYKSTFQDFVINNSDDVVVLFCIGSCGSCSSITTMFYDVASALCENKGLKFAYINPISNDVDEYDVKQYPLIALYSAADKNNPATFKGPCTETRITNFIRKNSYNRHAMPELISKSKAEF